MRRTIAGIVLVGGAGAWATEDGRFAFTVDDNAITTVEDTKREQTAGYGMAYDSTWSAWDNQTDGHAFNGETGYDTLTEAVEWVARHI